MKWDALALDRIGGSDELQLSSRRPDGSLRPFVRMWLVTVDGELFVRSAYGPKNAWYRRAMESGAGRIRVGALEVEATFVDAHEADHAAIDAEYHRKYDKFGAAIVSTVVGDFAHGQTVRIDPV